MEYNIQSNYLNAKVFEVLDLELWVKVVFYFDRNLPPQGWQINFHVSSTYD